MDTLEDNLYINKTGEVNVFLIEMFYLMVTYNQWPL